MSINTLHKGDDDDDDDDKLTDLITAHITEAFSHVSYPLFKVTCYCTYVLCMHVTAVQMQLTFIDIKQTHPSTSND